MAPAPVVPAAAAVAPPVDDEDPLDLTVRADGTNAAQARRVPGFLAPNEIDPVELAAKGGLAERLGLSGSQDDDQTDVGPVR
ncbi:hypothetical protein XM48_02500 [Leucobacter sp. Ag1]|nr:hypothetical protein XM48_02500 [Leucobacter sp. Ag1]